MNFLLAVAGLWVFILILAVIFSYFSYLPIPILTTIQGKSHIFFGKVTEIKSECSGRVVKVSLSTPIQTLDGDLLAMNFDGSFTEYLYFNDSQKIPNLGQVIKAEAYNRLYRVSGISINWVTNWHPYLGEIPTKAVATTTEIKQSSSECFLDD